MSTEPKPVPNALPPFSFADERIKEIFQKAEVCIQRYDLGHATMPMGDLLNLEDEIAVLNAYLGQIAAEYNHDHGKAYYNRLIARASKVQRAIISEGMKVTAAEKTVDADLTQERFNELETNYFAERVDNLSRNLRQLLDIIGRRITHLRDESKNVQYHGGQRQG